MTAAMLLPIAASPTDAAGLGVKYTSVVGNASWSWTLPKATKTGTWPVMVSCQSGIHKGSVARSLRVTK